MKKLKELRIKNNLTVKDMADLVGISQTYYWQIENKDRRLFYELAIKIAKVFNLKPDELFYEEFTQS
jgi:putative transcriptional regulator